MVSYNFSHNILVPLIKKIMKMLFDFKWQSLQLLRMMLLALGRVMSNLNKAIEEERYGLISVAFRAKVGEKYKLPLWSKLQKDYGAVACYKGRLTGFQESKWVDVELCILGEEHRKDLTDPYFESRLFVFVLGHGVDLDAK
ncbi:hypothetical protein POM88_052377 [Heracleum sosnowskyi]|uniref:Uncharacterized protein n=1 Tax=Heracleum sosnowskyi TaxID=360622 RepID=A0AAD8GQI4_9APIA|nr:hypothetical protein POM88_052377 [Heracleum sosnowskyi]